MNKARREQLTKLEISVNLLRDDVENIRDEEREYYDNMPEAIQAGERGTNAEQAVSDLEEAMSFL